MTKSAKSMALSGALLLSACASFPIGQPPLAAQAPKVNSLGELPAQQLNRGQCALVLWSRQSPPMRFLVTLDRPATARVQLGEKTVELVRVAQSGQPLFGQFPEQHYRGEGLTLDISFSAETSQGLSGGAVVSSAVVEYVDADGWTAVIPSAGLIACQT